MQNNRRISKRELLAYNDRLNQENQRARKEIEDLKRKLAGAEKQEKISKENYKELDDYQVELLNKNSGLKKEIGKKSEDVSKNQPTLSLKSLSNGSREKKPLSAIRETSKLQKRNRKISPSTVR